MEQRLWERQPVLGERQAEVRLATGTWRHQVTVKDWSPGGFLVRVDSFQRFLEFLDPAMSDDPRCEVAFPETELPRLRARIAHVQWAGMRESCELGVDCGVELTADLPPSSVEALGRYLTPHLVTTGAGRD